MNETKCDWCQRGTINYKAYERFCEHKSGCMKLDEVLRLELKVVHKNLNHARRSPNKGTHNYLRCHYELAMIRLEGIHAYAKELSHKERDSIQIEIHDMIEFASEILDLEHRLVIRKEMLSKSGMKFKF